MRDVKSRNGTLRATRAAATKARIEQAARSLFASRGYAATTLRDIADEAGVAVQTVYAVHATKANLMRALIQGVVDDPAADGAFGTAMASTSFDDALAAFALSMRLRWEAGHVVVAIHADAATADPTLRAEHAAAMRSRNRGLAALARHLVTLDRSLGGADRAVAVLDALTLPAMFTTLTTGHGWSADEYQGWLARAMRLLLVAEPARARSPADG